MATKQRIIEYLKSAKGEYISGQRIANHLDISRSAVWKAIDSLQKSGYKIDAVKNRGYRLAGVCDDISSEEITGYLKNKDFYNIKVFESLDSTNTRLLEDARTIAENGTVYVAKSQLCGRGRLGRTFVSQSRNGLYFSILLKKDFAPQDAAFLTTIAAVAVCGAIEKFCGISPFIKWVNDIYIDSKKVCGILTQALISVEAMCVDCAVVGIGINVFEPDNGFDSEIKDIAGAILKDDADASKSYLAALVLDEFKFYLDRISQRKLIMNEYRRRCFVLGKDITIIRGNESFQARAVEIDDDCALYVQCSDGRVIRLISGEISIKL